MHALIRCCTKGLTVQAHAGAADLFIPSLHQEAPSAAFEHAFVLMAPDKNLCTQALTAACLLSLLHLLSVTP